MVLLSTAQPTFRRQPGPPLVTRPRTQTQPSLPLSAQAESFDFFNQASTQFLTPHSNTMYAHPVIEAQAEEDGSGSVWVTILNLPHDHVNLDVWVRTLCGAFGTVQQVLLTASQHGSNRVDTAFVCFARRDQALAALQLDGRDMGGVRPLHVALSRRQPSSSQTLYPATAGALNTHNPAFHETFYPAQGYRSNDAASLVSQGSCPHSLDDYRNLYVLNLPLEATTDALAALFGRHGTVTHCVILSMLDKQARRRGFIDMAIHDQAKEAIKSLNGYVWHGYPIEVSYAIVQRSNGPLSGPNTARRTVPRSRWNCGPRRHPVDSSSPPSSSSDFGSAYYSAGQSDISLDHYHPRAQHAPSFAATAGFQAHPSTDNPAVDQYTVSVNGLDPVAIIDDDDLARLLSLYGRVVACSLSRGPAGFSLGHGVATFASTAEAANACQQLNGRIFHDRFVTCHLMPYPSAPLASQPAQSNRALESLSALSLASANDNAQLVPDLTWTSASVPLASDRDQDYTESSHFMTFARNTKENTAPAMYGSEPTDSSDSFDSSSADWHILPSSTTWPPLLADACSPKLTTSMNTSASEPWALSRPKVSFLRDSTNVWGRANGAASSGGKHRKSQESARNVDYGPIGSGSPDKADLSQCDGFSLNKPAQA
ncbi:unnamed protein product [Sympodiomycopsis kandeliae]